METRRVVLWGNGGAVESVEHADTGDVVFSGPGGRSISFGRAVTIVGSGGYCRAFEKSLVIVCDGGDCDAMDPGVRVIVRWGGRAVLHHSDARAVAEFGGRASIWNEDRDDFKAVPSAKEGDDADVSGIIDGNVEAACWRVSGALAYPTDIQDAEEILNGIELKEDKADASKQA